MTQTALDKTWRTARTFTAILVAFIIVFDLIVIVQQTRLLHSENHTHTENEFKLFGRLISSSLTKGDYTNVEEAVSQWGKEQSNILELEVIAENGFIIASFKRHNSTTDIKNFQGKIHYNLHKMATITMLRDISEISTAIHQLSLQLIGFSIVLVALLGFLLQRTAVRPLQNEINEHEQTESKLRQQASVLQEINNELESFSYSLSHDLRAPLRSITGFTQIILEDTGHKFNDEDNDHFQRILKASNRMAELIDDILELARVTRSDVQHTKVDLSALATEARDRLILTDDKRQVDWHIEDGLTAFGDKKLLALLFDNLLGNAYKYSANNKHARIEFGSKVMVVEGNAERTVFYIKDNGIGFDMQYINKLFKPFHRLHRDPAFEGTGIGLATVERIIHRHLGSIWAEAEPGKGACFYFTLGDQKQ